MDRNTGLLGGASASFERPLQHHGQLVGKADLVGPLGVLAGHRHQVGRQQWLLQQDLALLLCAEHDHGDVGLVGVEQVPDAVPRCIRVLMHLYTERGAAVAYLNSRPGLTGPGGTWPTLTGP